MQGRAGLESVETLRSDNIKNLIQKRISHSVSPSSLLRREARLQLTGGFPEFLRELPD